MDLGVDSFTVQITAELIGYGCVYAQENLKKQYSVAVWAEKNETCL